MLHNRKLIVLSGALAALLPMTQANAQTERTLEKPKTDLAKLVSQTTADEGASALDCQRPSEAREAKVIDFDAAGSVARLAVNLGSGRFTLVTIKAWDRPDDPRPLSPVIEAARIMQGKVQFFSRQLTNNPASAPDEFLIMTEMGGGYVCWAKPSWMMEQPGPPVAEAPRPPATATAVKPEPAPAVVTPAAVSSTEQADSQQRRRRRPPTFGEVGAAQ